MANANSSDKCKHGNTPGRDKKNCSNCGGEGEISR